MKETDGEKLARLGTDAAKWTDEFMRINDGLFVHSDGSDAPPGYAPYLVNWGAMVGWFANAIEAGRTASLRNGEADG